jgi:ribose transport system permease protein
MVLSNNRMVYQFGPDQAQLLTLGGGFLSVGLPFLNPIRVPNPVLFLVVMALIVGLAFRWTKWGRHLFAIGGNEEAANLTGVPVPRMKLSVYMFCSLCAGIAGILEVGWLGTITTSLGQGMELTVIAASVIGGANLTGGAGTAFGAVVGAALIEVIRNSLILLGISTFWQGTFVGSFIIIAVLFDRLRTRTSND